MDFSKNQKSAGRRWVGLGSVILLHVLVVYALVTGLARKAIEVVRGPLETKIIEEIKKLPPPDKPPPPPPPQKVVPPPFVPPPEVAIAPSTGSVNTITVAPKQAPVVEEPPPKPALRTAPVIDAGRSCRKPEYPSASRRMEEEGVVVLSFLIGVDGRVTESRVASSSGFARLDEAARQAMSLCQFKPGTVDGKPEPAWAKLRYEWRLETE